METFRPAKNRAFVDEKVIAIGVLEDWTPYDEASLNRECEFRIFSEWDLGNEKSVIESFYNLFKDLLSDAYFLTVVGFNILRFDIPLLKQKGAEYGVAPLPELNNLWYSAGMMDFFQAALPIRNMRFKGNNLRNLLDLARKVGIRVEVDTYGTGEDVAQWYMKGEYREIEKHLKADVEALRVLDLTQSIPKILKISQKMNSNGR